jgi:hypothetical protein
VRQARDGGLSLVLLGFTGYGLAMRLSKLIAF